MNVTVRRSWKVHEGMTPCKSCKGQPRSHLYSVVETAMELLKTAIIRHINALFCINNGAMKKCPPYFSPRMVGIELL